ncbi:unnamed protein product [Arabis nemorensis]|uniref:Uncharacterized protein n=1 Tax=Arabis nemorensis TaxID=586526 RepID=A0A565CDZ9_9BRAS|nr:unnamed protein product [Arabis nemorensis]
MRIETFNTHFLLFILSISEAQPISLSMTQNDNTYTSIFNNYDMLLIFFAIIFITVERKRSPDYARGIKVSNRPFSWQWGLSSNNAMEDTNIIKNYTHR